MEYSVPESWSKEVSRAFPARLQLNQTIPSHVCCSKHQIPAPAANFSPLHPNYIRIIRDGGLAYGGYSRQPESYFQWADSNHYLRDIVFVYLVCARFEDQVLTRMDYYLPCVLADPNYIRSLGSWLLQDDKAPVLDS